MWYGVLKKITKYKNDILIHEIILSGIVMHCGETNMVQYPAQWGLIEYLPEL
jgi:hypothetical protein